MKKTCVALVIGLLITTNVYAKETKISDYCKEIPVIEFIENLHKINIKVQQNQKTCKDIY